MPQFIQMNLPTETLFFTNRGGKWHEFLVNSGEGPQDGEEPASIWDVAVEVTEADAAPLASLLASAQAEFDRNGFAPGKKARALTAAGRVRDLGKMTSAQKAALLATNNTQAAPLGPSAPVATGKGSNTPGSGSSDEAPGSSLGGVAVFGVLVLLGVSAYVVAKK